MTSARPHAPARARTTRRVSLATLLAAVLMAGGVGPATAAAAPAAAHAMDTTARVVPAATAAVAGTPLAAASTKGHRLALKVSDTSPRRGEALWFVGRLLRIDYPVTGAKIVIERRAAGSKTWKKVRTATTSKSGRFTVRERTTGSASYRARVKVSGVTITSATRTIKARASSRSMTSRVAALGSRLGTARSGAVKSNLKGYGTVVHRSYTKGVLVRTGKGKKTRTWFVNGPIRDAYMSQGGPRGKLGVPLADARCGLVESGCVQRFSGGAVYDNKNTKPTTFLGKSKAVEVLAAAKSQAGYTQKRHNRSKYNTWMGSSTAWCSFFQSWVFAASGHKGLVSQSPRFASFLSKTRSTLKTGSKPKVGALVFFDTISDGRVAATHVGIVARVNARTITTYEGNTSNPKNSSQRGAYLKTRSLGQPLYYAYPEYR